MLRAIINLEILGQLKIFFVDSCLPILDHYKSVFKVAGVFQWKDKFVRISFFRFLATFFYLIKRSLFSFIIRMSKLLQDSEGFRNDSVN